MQEKVMPNTPYAEVHSMDMSIKSPSSVDVSDLDIPSSNSDIKSPAEIALEPLGDEVYDPTEQKAESDEFTIGDLIGDLL